MSTEMELKMVKNDYNIPTEQLEYYKNRIMDFLPKYRYKDDKHYNPTEKGLNNLLRVYNESKGWMYPYFMSHPNYIGNGKIAFSSDYHRGIDYDACAYFINWVSGNAYDYYKTNYSYTYSGMTYKEICDALERMNRIYNGMCTIEGVKLGSGWATPKVNGMSLDEFSKELYRINKIREEFEKKGTRIFGGCYITKEGYKEYGNLNKFLAKISDNPHTFTTPEEVDELNNLTKSFDLRIVSGQKFSRIINKLCHKLGIDKLNEYNKLYAKFSDGINEFDIKRHTIISINPIDYLTMSFGNSWSSCHSIDKMNDRQIEGSFSGSWSGGTLSYMLDSSSVVFYTVDGKYDGTDFELQPKINRCMFHLGEDKLVQGRVYPQTNDSASGQGLYNEIRTIMQKVVSEMFNFDNLWIIKKGTNECEKVVMSYGVHYKDYVHYNTCNVSYVKPSKDKTKNTKMIPVGHGSICPTCGTEHYNSRAIICRECFNNIKKCPHCGRTIRENDHIEIDGQVYCSNCAKWCDFHQRWEIDTDMVQLCTSGYMVRANRRNVYARVKYSNNYVCLNAISENPARYRQDASTGDFFDTQTYTDGIKVYNVYNNLSYYYASKDYAEYLGYKKAYNGKYYHKNDLYYDRHTGVKAYIPSNEWNFELNCWNEIVEEVRQHNEMLAQRAERRVAREARRNAENAA